MFGLGKTWAHIEFFGENLPHPQNDCDRPSLAFQTSYRKQQASLCISNDGFAMEY